MPDCSKYATTMCNNTAYRHLMSENCAKTCNLCEDVGCLDSTARSALLNCPAWDRVGFCDSSYYTDEQKKSFCASTCKLCEK
ncbi:unnamed protein product [Heligmosomoides polygyrus]|uniref:ShKT domain-containing protein n=1 Tax=Heligmosomoides polygyrus TaxID=6339 RepID=A0A3P8C5D9_HELPZ|nr:unnamed protein product [Heligmosomoides polygyrus]